MSTKRKAPPAPLPRPDPEPQPPEVPKGTTLEETIRTLLSVPKTGGSIPTLTCIDKGIYKRYFILDVDGPAYRRAWEAFREERPLGTPEEFVQMVQTILSTGLPRMFRAVSYVPLI